MELNERLGEINDPPCDTCSYCESCRDNGLTCQTFRNYTDEASGAPPKMWAWPRMPDKVWAKSFRDM